MVIILALKEALWGCEVSAGGTGDRGQKKRNREPQRQDGCGVYPRMALESDVSCPGLFSDWAFLCF